MPAELSYHRLKWGWLAGVVVAFALFMLVAAYSSRMTYDYPGYDRDRAAVRYATLAKVRAAEDKLLHPVDDQGKPTAVWVDQDKGLIQIPIDEAMTHELDDLQKQPAAQGCEIPGAVPAPAAAPAVPATPATTNAAPAAPAAPTATAKKAKAKNTAPSAPDLQKKKPSPAASTAAPNAATPPAANKESN